MNTTPSTSEAEANAPQQWSADLAAEDLVAQLEDALAGPMSRADLLEVLRFQGLPHDLATALMTEVQPRPEEAGQPSDTRVELVSTRMFLTVDVETRRAALSQALIAQGLTVETAEALVTALIKLNQKQTDLIRRRRRMLGVQGTAVGAVATGLLTYGGLYGGGTAYWHLLTALFSGGLMLYSIVLWRRNL